MQTFVRAAAVIVGTLAVVTMVGRARAQGDAHHAPREAAARSVPAPAERIARNVALHLELTPRATGNAADSARAMRVARTLRAALAPFRDTSAAVAAGYRMFAPGLKEQRVYHFTNNWRAVQEGFRFDATRPTSLLYTKSPDGTFTLVGAMFTAPKRFGAVELDARVPIGIAQWHRHVNWCLPKRADQARWAERRDGVPVFGPESPIATQAACDAVGGTFRENVFGWMVHANVFAGDDAASIWGDEHAGHAMHEGLRAEAPSIPK